MVGRIEGPSTADASASAPQPLTKAQIAELNQYYNNLWSFTYASTYAQLHHQPIPPMTPTQMMMMAQSIHNFIAFVQSLGNVTLDPVTAQLMQDFNPNERGSIGYMAEQLSFTNFTDYSSISQFEQAYQNSTINSDVDAWYHGGGLGTSVAYTPNVYVGPDGMHHTTKINYSKWVSDVQQLYKDLAQYNQNPTVANAEILAACVSAVQADYGSASNPPPPLSEMDPYEAAVYQMLNTPDSSGQSLNLLAYDYTADPNPHTADNINQFFQVHAQAYASILNMMINDYTGEF